jgi:hypothetical protein
MIKFLLLNLFCSTAFSSVLVKEVILNQKDLSEKHVLYSTRTVNRPLVIRELPLYMGEQDFTSKEIYRETLYPDSTPEFFISTNKDANATPAGSEMRTIIKQGPDANRIVLTILGDGYTDAEKEKFFEDAKFIVDDLFVGVTFKSYLPLFNIYAVFTPSKESGISDKVKKKTAFGLYRSPAGSKRAIMPGNTSAIEAALALAPTANYPIILANDELYGGLGGRYAITTRSRVSGPIVLRHELGHNFSNVGEEYDDGQVYSGANFSRTGIGSWDQWRENSNKEKHEANYVFGAYVWQELSKPFVQDFSTDETSSLFSVKISSVGWEKEGDVEILLDSSPLKLTGHFTKDRSFFETEPFVIRPGKHQLLIRSNGNNPAHVLAFADGFGYPRDYDFHSGEVKAFNVFNDSRTMLGYRPTENTCLMRDMLSKVFCPVDQENIWLQFLMRVSLIDSLSKTSDGKVELKTPQLAANNLDISWFEGEKELTQYKGQKIIPASVAPLKVKVKLLTPEVRLKSEYLQFEKTI